MKYYLLFLLFNALATECFSQVADTSYALITINDNPAVIGRRSQSFFSFEANYLKENVEFNSRNSREITVQNNEMIFSSQKILLRPELYLQRSSGTRKSTSGSSQSETKESLTGGQLNLSLINLPRLMLGFQYFMLSSDFKGPGFGTSIGLLPSLFIGGFYRSLSSESQYQNGDRSQWALGISKIIGDRKSSSLRLELSYGQMTSLTVPGFEGGSEGDTIFAAVPSFTPKPGELISLTVEASLTRLVAGLRIDRDSGNYIRIRNVLKNSLEGGNIPESEAITNFGGFLSFRAQKGSSFGISGMYSKGDSSVRNSEGGVTIAKKKSLTLGLSYNYVF